MFSLSAGLCKNYQAYFFKKIKLSEEKEDGQMMNALNFGADPNHE